ncbi:aldo/keto reductase [Verrucomicrobium sp. GAS474]|uniref:aldo/keto reductase n=1 Tax=Verrucomicrobium sp. GAS474 TaxID=1882831 RepID=UPI000B86EA04
MNIDPTWEPPIDLRLATLPLASGAGAIPALGFGTLIVGPAETRRATADALRAGFRHLDCAERYRNEREVGEALRAGFESGAMTREEVFLTTKLWNTNHRPERVEPAFDASCARLGVDYIDLYLAHTPFAFAPGAEMDPRDEEGRIVYDDGVTLLETWRAMERLVDQGKCRAIGLSDVTLETLIPLYEAARIKPAVIQVESHPYLPQTELLEFCHAKGIVFLAFAPLGHGIRPGPLDDPVIVALAREYWLTPAQVLLAWGIQRGTAILTTPKSPARARESRALLPLPQSALDEIDAIPTRIRLNSVVETGVPGFIARGR